MTPHTVHTHGAPCSLCKQARRVIYLPRTVRRRPATYLICDTCDQPIPTTPREPR